MGSPPGSSLPTDGTCGPPSEMDGIGTQDRTKEAFQELVRNELPGLYSLARRLVRDGAEDLVQETLLQGYRSFARLEHEAAGGRWLRTILVNLFRDQLRKRARSVEEFAAGDLEDFSLYRTLIDEDPLPYSDTLHADFLGAFGREDLHEVLMRMPEIYRAPLVLRYMEGFSTKEIARLLDAPLGTILARLHRGRNVFERTMWTYAEETRLLAMGDDDG
jgi:RNA polymerase sigma-70 factor, ECF subfamily